MTARQPWSGSCCCTAISSTPTCSRGFGAAVALGTCSEDVVALEARKTAQAAGRAPTVTAAAPSPYRTERPDPELPQVSHLTSRRLAWTLPEDARPLPRLEQWDELLHLHRKESP
ncbi:hypothetical protein [Streptomyces pseudovenezuelae]|uniref:Uncharacterized protein n=1 Tax=Streptomyces pseudovenezuelae TaxID=67350 RepID=A0ABT6LZ66_9ACTN|nr:hypothetical protein [Streptomyces pseudovenezuelae]MDH6221104.1 hypothetical protein [Streptomyces pseudovenezuelae]